MNKHIVIIGSGKLGQVVGEHLKNTKKYSISFLNRSNSDNEYQKAIEVCDIIFDCSSYEAVIKNARYACEANKPIIFGTSNIESYIDQLRTMFNNSNTCGCHIPNFAVTFPYFIGLCKQLNVLQSSKQSIMKCDHQIVETHHILKKDKPSGSAKYLKQTLPTSVDISSIRIDNHPGQHTYKIKTPFETIEISHIVHDRSAYGIGAVRLVPFVIQKTGWVEYDQWLLYFNKTEV